MHMNEYTTGNARVDQMGQIRITGNVTPQVWYKTITRKNGKPHLLAIAILSDIVYQWRYATNPPDTLPDTEKGLNGTCCSAAMTSLRIFSVNQNAA